MLAAGDSRAPGPRHRGEEALPEALGRWAQGLERQGGRLTSAALQPCWRLNGKVAAALGRARRGGDSAAGRPPPPPLTPRALGRGHGALEWRARRRRSLQAARGLLTAVCARPAPRADAACGAPAPSRRPGDRGRWPARRQRRPAPRRPPPALGWHCLALLGGRRGGGCPAAAARAPGPPACAPFQALRGERSSGAGPVGRVFAKSKACSPTERGESAVRAAVRLCFHP